MWAVGAVAIEVVDIPGVDGDELVLAVEESGERSLDVDGRPAPGFLPEVEAAARGRRPPFVLRGARIEDSLWEVQVDPL